MCAAAGYNPCPGSNPQAITCPGGELIRSPNPHSDIYIYCLLYTSDAADEEDSVDLVALIIKKKKTARIDR